MDEGEVDILRKTWERDDHCCSQSDTCQSTVLNYSQVSEFLPGGRKPFFLDTDLALDLICSGAFSSPFSVNTGLTQVKMSLGAETSIPLLLLGERSVLSAHLIYIPKIYPRLRPNVREELGWVSFLLCNADR